MRGLFLAATGAIGLAFAGNAVAAPVFTARPNFDATFPGLCGGVACEQAVPEIRNGDNGTSPSQNEWQNSLNTGVIPGPGGAVNITGTNGIWNGAPYAFSLSYNAATDLLRLGVNLGSGFQNADYTVDLATTVSLFLRATARAGSADTSLTRMVLNGTPVPDLFGNDTADYLQVSSFNWNSDWTLTGNVAMTGGATGGNSRPSVQFKLTNLPGPPNGGGDPNVIPAPAALSLLGLGILALGALRRRG
jgi:hypothetical protein